MPQHTAHPQRCLRQLPPSGPRTHTRLAPVHTAPRPQVYFPVFVEGANLSMGDMHFSQGDGEVSFCGAIEMSGFLELKWVPLMPPTPLCVVACHD